MICEKHSPIPACEHFMCVLMIKAYNFYSVVNHVIPIIHVPLSCIKSCCQHKVVTTDSVRERNKTEERLLDH